MTYIDDVLPTDTEFLTPTEVAGLFRVTTATVTNWRRRGLIQAIRTPGTKRLLFRREDIAALLTENEQ